jgi:dienelactone hydrolase
VRRLLALVIVIGATGALLVPAGDVASAATGPTRQHTVVTVTRTFVDHSRPTPAVAGSTAAAATSRTLVTTIWVPAGKGRFPLIVFAHGNGANPQAYEKLVIPWVAAGYVVAAPTFPVSGHDGGNEVAGIADLANQPGDARFVLDRVLALARHKGNLLFHRIDVAHIGVAGHSLGAITTLGVAERSCCRDPRVDAAIAISGTPLVQGTDFAGKAPALLLIHGTADTTVPYSGSTLSYSRAAPPKYLLTVIGGHHSDFLAPTGAPPSSDVARATLDFWNAYLRGDRAARARLPGDATAGATTMQSDAAPAHRTATAHTTASVDSVGVTPIPANMQLGEPVGALAPNPTAT